MRSFTSPFTDCVTARRFLALGHLSELCALAVLLYFLAAPNHRANLIWRVAFTGSYAAADTASIPLFSRPNISIPCWITLRPWSSEKPLGGITQLLLNGGTLKWKEHAVFFKKRANPNPYAFVFKQQIEKIWLHGIKNTWIEWFTSKFMLDSEMKHERWRMIPWNPEFTVDLPRMKAKIVWLLWHLYCTVRCEKRKRILWRC